VAETIKLAKRGREGGNGEQKANRDLLMMDSSTAVSSKVYVWALLW
jgi:hypothetical protein